MILVPLKDADKSRYGNHESGAILSRYKAKGKRLALAKAEIVKRFPVSGNLCNGKRTLTIYVVSGEGEVSCGKGTLKISDGDIVKLSAGERFFLTTLSTLTLLTNPPLDPRR